MTRVLLAALLLLEATTVHAEDPAVVLARVCVAESGWHDRDTCAAEVYVLQRRADRQGWPVTRMGRAYSAAWRTRTRPWLFDLRDRARAPRGWPRASWRRHRPLWRALVAHVRGALSGAVADPCAADQPDHFGATYDEVPDSWQRARCLPGSRQRFWVSRPGGRG